VLAPLCEREILYRLLKGPQGTIVRQIARAGSRSSEHITKMSRQVTGFPASIF
jgi:hypothetical protein